MTRYEQSVQDTDEDGTLDCELQATEQIRQDIGDPEPLPQPPEEERPPDADRVNELNRSRSNLCRRVVRTAR